MISRSGAGGRNVNVGKADEVSAEHGSSSRLCPSPLGDESGQDAEAL